MQELRGQGPAKEGRQGRQVPALQGDGRAVTSGCGGFEAAAGPSAIVGMRYLMSGLRNVVVGYL